MTQTFYNTITGMVDHYLPLMTVKRHTTDKPWVTDQFRRFIRCCQNALKNSQVARSNVQESSTADVKGIAAEILRTENRGFAVQ